MVFRMLGERTSFADQAADALKQRSKPPLHVAGLSVRFAAAAVDFFWKHGGEGIPEVAPRGSTTVALGNDACMSQTFRWL